MSDSRDDTATTLPDDAASGVRYDDGYDVVVIGAGAGGLSAALVLGRARLRVAVVDGGEPRNAPAAHMQGFLSRDGMAPAALLEVGRAEVAGYGVEFVDGHVDDVTDAYAGPDSGPDSGLDTRPGTRPDAGSRARFHVRLAGGAALAARHVVVATGLRDELPGIPGLRERWGKDVLHCPYCHAYEVRDRPLGVLGSSPLSVRQALLVREWSDDVVYFPHTQEPAADEREQLAALGVRVVEGEVKRLVTDGDRLRGVELAAGQVVPCDAVFTQTRTVPRDGFLSGLGCAHDENGWLVTDAEGRTGVPGVWAVGNVADPRAQVIVAAGAGYATGVALHHELVAERVARAVTARRARGAGTPA
ncbi:NAD(P)/FAD-dependent oxidoreductase [Streptomyces sp. NPDC059063]|uniref:NAD(P)/FAD-dependent oxidoreductase n=1 Tax=unclassified Streptomyces TaxID=2593676 RepID=UPI0036C16FF0